MTIGYTVYEPMNYTDESGTFTGFDTELATAVCEKLGLEPDFVEINWDTKETELAAKSIDCIWNGLTLTDDREANMACTKPYVKNAQVVVMKADADYTSTADLAGVSVRPLWLSPDLLAKLPLKRTRACSRQTLLPRACRPTA